MYWQNRKGFNSFFLIVHGSWFNSLWLNKTFKSFTIHISPFTIHHSQFTLMNTEISGVILMYVLTVALAIPLGKYIGKILEGERTWPDRLFNPIDNAFFKLGGIDPK